jgi:predicted O-methyltransferase YrrM
MARPSSVIRYRGRAIRRRLAPIGARGRAIRIRLAPIGPWPASLASARPSLISSSIGTPSERLLDVAIGAIAAARTADLSWLADESRHIPYVDRQDNQSPVTWPGNHYRLLYGIVQTIRPKTVVEIGTSYGISALAMKAALPEDGKITTFDLHPKHRYQDSADAQLEQRLDDLSTPEGLSANADLLKRADFIFIDSKHDGDQERAFLRGFEEVGLDNSPLLAFDDIRHWQMLAFWREIERPKLDLTSFGHWTGTGLVDWS